MREARSRPRSFGTGSLAGWARRPGDHKGRARTGSAVLRHAARRSDEAALHSFRGETSPTGARSNRPRPPRPRPLADDPVRATFRRSAKDRVDTAPGKEPELAGKPPVSARPVRC